MPVVGDARRRSRRRRISPRACPNRHRGIDCSQPEACAAPQGVGCARSSAERCPRACPARAPRGGGRRRARRAPVRLRGGCERGIARRVSRGRRAVRASTAIRSGSGAGGEGRAARAAGLRATSSASSTRRSTHRSAHSSVTESSATSSAKETRFARCRDCSVTSADERGDDVGARQSQCSRRSRQDTSLVAYCNLSHLTCTSGR
jgi:hypothetical protein